VSNEKTVIRRRGSWRKVQGMLSGKKVLVVGLARSGIGATNLLAFLGAEVWVTDIKPAYSLKDNIERLSPVVKVFAGGYPEELFSKAEIIILSPGVPLDIAPVVHAKARGVPVIGELELAYQVIQDEKGHVPFIAVTGTNGKSTVTTLVDLMLKKAGFKTLLGGNIGNALTEEILISFLTSQLPDFIVTEVSSFQLESIMNFRPKVSSILNITPDHLDRYHTMEEYINAKARIFENQGAKDSLILNADDPIIKKVEGEKLKVKNEKPNILYFSRRREVEGIYLKDGMIYCNFPKSELPGLALRSKAGQTQNSELIKPADIRIKGVHNLENAMAASLVALLCGCPEDAVRDVLKDFRGLEHRLEYVCEIQGVTFINDSKGTNIGAVTKSLESFQRIILIMGGRDKGGDFLSLKDLIKERVKALILLGEAKEKIAKAMNRVVDIVFVDDLEEAVSVSLSKASPGDVVLLSPGCVSFDMFQDFEDRGRRFKEIVQRFKVRATLRKDSLKGSRVQCQ